MDIGKGTANGVQNFVIRRFKLRHEVPCQWLTWFQWHMMWY